MNTLEFLQRILPTTGYYAALVIDQRGKYQKFFRSIKELAKAVTILDKNGLNTYYAISSFIEEGSRKQANVKATKVIALDVDCGQGKPFPNWKQGLVALGRFVTEMKLPKPLIVHSGNGLHVYWVLDRELEPTRWKPLAEAMKAAAKAAGFAIDPAVPADSARVLRPIGTTNPKSGTKVRVLIDAQPVTVEQMTSALAKHITPHSPDSKLSRSLQINYNLPPANAEIVAQKCPQINWGITNQAEVEEPFWYSLLGIAAYCQDPEATAIAWSNKYPGFSEAETLRKLKQWAQAVTGPTTCSRFEQLRPTGCKNCKFKGKVTTPASLGLQYAETKPVDVPSIVPIDVLLPKPFKRTKDGIKITIDGVDLDVCPFDIYPISYGKDEGLGYEVVRYIWNRPHVGWQELVLRQAFLVEGNRDFAIAIADQGILLPNRTQTTYFQIMLRAYMDELRKIRGLTNMYSTMGWKENYTQFVIGDTLFRRNADGTVREESINLSATSTKLSKELWTTAGSLKAWVAFTSLLEKADLRAHQFALAVGLSAPLYAFTGLKGLTISLFGPTGGGKTLAQLWVQSIYGNPEKLHFTAKFTQHALFNRMGLYSNMPMTIDEVTTLDDLNVGDYIYWVTQGRDKIRLTKTAEEKEARTWALPVIVSTNRSLGSKLVAAGLETDAQYARVLEVSIPPSPLFLRDSTPGRKIYDFITNNYGHVGRAFIKKLLEMGEEGIKAAIADAMATFRLRYKAEFNGSERYWEQAIVLADLAARLAKEWGLIAFDHKNGIEWVLAQIGAIRRALKGFKRDSFDLLTEYLNDTVKSHVIIYHTDTKKPVMDYSRMPHNDVRVRFDFYRKSQTDPISSGTVMIDRVHLRRWLAQRGVDYKSFVSEFENEGIIATPKCQKAYLAKDTPIRLGQSYVLGLNLNHPRLYGILSDADEALDNLTLGQLKVVQ